jgi:hypothetical protein
LNFTVLVALFGWPLVALTLCALLPARRAVIVAYVAAWLFLPVYAYEIKGFPEWTKMSATSISLLGALMIFDLRTLTAFRLRWFDLPMLAWCLSPAAASLANDLGLYDAASAFRNHAVTWGIPYFLGRLYFSDFDGLRELALGLFIGGLIYVPLCLYEIRMSPQLHTIVYGFHQHSFAQTKRFGGWRPTVFMDHGLMVGIWMSMSSLAGIWLWLCGGLRSFRGISILWFLVPLLVTTVLCKSAGALVLLLMGIALLFWVRRYQTRAPLYLLGAVAPLYILLRLTGIWTGAAMVEAAQVFSSERADSLETRLRQEDMLAAKALQRPVFGWAGWNRSRIADETGTDIAITDGLWIIEFGQRGLFGLAAMLSVFLLPAIALARSAPAREWTRPYAAPAAALAAVVVLYLIDCIPNAHVTPVFTLALGGLTALKVYRKPEPAPEESVTES